MNPKEYLYKAKRGQIAQGLKLGISDLDDHFRFKSGAFNVVIGHANVGKTTTILYFMLLYSMKHGLKWWVFSVENNPNTLYQRLVEFYTNKPIQQMSDAEIDHALMWVQQHFKIADSDRLYSYRDILQLMEIEMGLDGGFDGVLVDPYNALMKDPKLLREVGGHEYDYQVASEFRLFCKKNNVTLYLNCHCHTDALRKTHPKGHEYENLPVPPNMADVEGGGKWGNRADDLFTYHRYVHHPTEWMYTEVHVRKVKETETGGKPTSLDRPIRMRMVLNNCGFEIGGINPLNGLITDSQPR